MKMIGLLALGFLFGGFWADRRQYSQNYRVTTYIVYLVAVIATIFPGVA